MNAKASAVRSELLSLPTRERAVLAVELLASLDEDVVESMLDDVDRHWGDEMVRRSEQIAAGRVATLSWSDVLEQVAASRNAP